MPDTSKDIADVRILVLGHGSRNRTSNEEFGHVVRQLGAVLPNAPIDFAFIELAEPGFLEALRTVAVKARKIIILPLFLFRAGHVKNDIYLALKKVREEFPNVEFESTDVLGVHPNLVKLAARRLAECQASLSRVNKKNTSIVIVGRGSSDADANAEFARMARLIEESTDYQSANYTFIGITTPLVPDTLQQVANGRPDQILILPYMLFRGVLIERLENTALQFEKDHPWLKVRVAAHLGSDPLLLETVKSRLQDMDADGGRLDCGSCQYREPLSNPAQADSGIRALLWSMRHDFVHKNEKPEDHAHAALKRHIFVCGNVDCVDGDSLAVLQELRNEVRKRGLTSSTRITRTSCMGRCGEGPTLVVYPDAIWYRKFLVEDVSDFVTQHLEQDRPLQRRLDQILT